MLTGSRHRKLVLSVGFGLYLTLSAAALLWVLKLTPQPQPTISSVELQQAAPTLTLHGTDLNSRCDAVLVASSNLEDSVIAKRFTWGDAFDIKIKKGIAWVANHSKGLIAYNIDDPAHPFAISSLDFPVETRAWSLAFSDEYAIISASLHGLYIADLHDPQQPRLISHLALPGVTQQITTQGDLAIVASGNRGMHIVDISNKKAPVLLSNLPLDNYLHCVTVKGNRAYLSGGAINNAKANGCTYIVDISTPEKPFLVKQILHESKVWDSLIVNNTLLCGTTNGVFQLDLSSGKTDVFIPDVYVTQLFYDDKKLFIITRYQRIYQYTVDGTPSYQKTFTTDHRACRAMDIQGHYAFIASGAFGLSVLDLTGRGEQSEPALPTYDVLRPKDPIYVVPGQIALFDKNAVLLARKKTEGSNYTIINTIQFPEEIKEICQEGTTLYLAIQDRGIYSLDISPLQKNIPQLCWETKALVKSLSVENGILYLSIKDEATMVIPLARKTFDQPQRIPEQSRSITADNNVVYLTKDPNGLAIYQLSNGSAPPKRISQINYPDRLEKYNLNNGLFLLGDTLFISNSKGILSIDVSQPSRPRILDSFEVTKHCRSVQIADNIAYLNYTHGGAALIDLSDPANLKQLCTVDEMKKIRVSDGKMFNLDLIGNVTVDIAPLKLDKHQHSSNKICYALPSSIPDGEYDLYISDDLEIREIRKALHFERGRGWKFDKKKAMSQLTSRQ